MRRLIAWLRRRLRRRARTTDDEMAELRDALEAELEKHRHG